MGNWNESADFRPGRRLLGADDAPENLEFCRVFLFA